MGLGLGQGHPKEAAGFEEVTEKNKFFSGVDHPQTLASMANTALSLCQLNRDAEGLKL